MPNIPVGTPVTVRLRDFSGGWNPSDSPSLLSDREAHVADNVSFDQRGTLIPRKGRRKRFSLPVDSQRITGLASLVTKDKTSRLVMAVGDKLYYDEPHLDHRWDSQADWKATGSALYGSATADRTAGSMRNSDVPPYRNMKQLVTITGSPTGGYFLLAFKLAGGGPQIPYNADAATVKASLIALSTINGDNETQTITLTGSPTGGTFTLTFNGQTTTALAKASTAAQVKAALEALSSIGVGNVGVTGNASGPWTVEFKGTLASSDQSQMTAASSLTGGTSPNVAIATTVQGSPLDIDVIGNAGGPWTVEFKGQFQYQTVELLYPDPHFTGGTSPSVTVTIAQAANDSSSVTQIDTDAEWNTGTKDNVVVGSNQISLARKASDQTDGWGIGYNAWTIGTLDNVMSVATALELIPTSPGVYNNPVGTWTSPVLSAIEAYQGDLVRSVIPAPVSAPADGECLFEYRVGATAETLGNWISQGTGGVGTGNTLNTLGNFVQYRYTLRTFRSNYTPHISYFKVTWRSAFADIGYWISPPVDLRGLDLAATSLLEWTASNAGIHAQMRTSIDTAGVVWGPWYDFAAQGAFPADPSGAAFMQYRMVVPRLGLNSTPNCSTVKLTLSTDRVKGMWESEPIDVSQAANRSTAQVSIDASVGNDKLTIQYCYTEGAPGYTPWTDALADGTLDLSETAQFVKIRLTLYGNTVEARTAVLILDGSSVANLLASGLTANAEYSFAQLKDNLIIANGYDQPQKWTGAGALQPLGGSPPILRLVVAHLNMLWGVEKENPSRLRFTDILNIDSWPPLNFFDFLPEDGSEIAALYKAGDSLLISKQNAVALLTGDRPATFSVVWLDAHERGPVGPRSVASVDRFIAYVASDGIRISDLTRSMLNSQKLVIPWEQDINQRRLDQAAIVFWDHYLLVALPSKASLYNDTVWILDTLRSAWAQIPAGTWNVSCWLKFRQYGGEILLAGDSTTGQVYQVMVGDDDDGVPVEFEWQGAEMDLGYSERYKLFNNHTLTVEGMSGQTTLKVFYKVIGGTTESGDFQDGWTEYAVDPIAVPAGEGVTHIYRILPPVWGAVLGRAIAIRIVTGANVFAQTMDMTVKGIVPGGL